MPKGEENTQQLSAVSEFETALAKLPRQRALFVREYLVDLNATQAAMRAGYSKKTANEQAARLLANVSIKNCIALGQKRLADKLDIRAETVLRELARLGFSDMSDFADWDEEGVVTLTPSSELTENQRRAVARVKRTRRMIPQKKGPPIEETELEFKLHEKKGALDSLGKHLGLFKDGGGLDEKIDQLLDVFVKVLRRFVPREQLERAVTELGRLADGSFGIPGAESGPGKAN